MTSSNPNLFYNIAALYVDTKHGPYPNIHGVDCWDEQRDALTYPGGLPVIAHPSCAAWGTLAYFATVQKAIKHHALVAVHQVIACGGVLEHPENSKLWRTCNLPKPYKKIPKTAPWLWALEIDQCRFGHKARKMTWLLFAGVAPHHLPPLPPPRKPTHVVSALQYNRVSLPRLRAGSAHLTPPDFAAWLVAAVRNASEIVISGSGSYS